MIAANRKPWGYEYLAYENSNVAIWHLMLKAGEETSLHSHPNKKTGLIVLDGAAKVSFLDGHQKLFAGEKVMIRQGVFHRTKNMTTDWLSLLEIETPVNKSDIIRLLDNYGRAGKPYEEECIMQIDPISLSDRIGSCDLCFGKWLDVDAEEYKILIITDGYIKHDGTSVCGPGDVLSVENLNKLIDNFGPAELEGIFIKSWI